MTNLLKEFEESEIKRLQNDNIESFRPGDTISVETNIFENGTFLRTQVFEGICISIRNRGLHTSFSVHKVTMGEGVIKTFLKYSSVVKSVKVLRCGKVRRAKLYYLCNLRGKAARIKERSFSGNKQNSNSKLQKNIE